MNVDEFDMKMKKSGRKMKKKWYYSHFSFVQSK